MELIDRYLQAVEFWLPKPQKNDIIAELSGDIYGQVEEQESEQGRTLNEGEVEAILKRRGSPVLVANRYSPQEHLIGPVLFPIYKFVLKVVTFCYLVPWVLVWVGLMVFDPAYRAVAAGHAVTCVCHDWYGDARIRYFRAGTGPSRTFSNIGTRTSCRLSAIQPLSSDPPLTLNWWCFWEPVCGG